MPVTPTERWVHKLYIPYFKLMLQVVLGVACLGYFTFWVWMADLHGSLTTSDYVFFVWSAAFIVSRAPAALSAAVIGMFPPLLAVGMCSQLPPPCLLGAVTCMVFAGAGAVARRAGV